MRFSRRSPSLYIGTYTCYYILNDEVITMRSEMQHYKMKKNIRKKIKHFILFFSIANCHKEDVRHAVIVVIVSL